MHALKLVLNKSMRVSDDKQGMKKLWPKVKGRGGTVNKTSVYAEAAVRRVF